jgi:hypothetical protein
VPAYVGSEGNDCRQYRYQSYTHISRKGSAFIANKEIIALKTWQFQKNSLTLQAQKNG